MTTQSKISVPILMAFLLLVSVALLLPSASAASASPTAIDTKQNASLTLMYGYTGDYPIPMNATIGLDGRLTPLLNGSGTLYWSVEGSGYIYQRDITFVDGRYRGDFNFTSPGGWCFKAVFHGDDSYNSAESSDVCMSVVGTKQNATLTIATSTASATAGSNVTLSGSFSPLQSGTIYLYYSVNGSAFSQLATTWASAGSYSHNTTLTHAGSYSYYAAWSGNGAYNSTISNTVSVTSQAAAQPGQPAGVDSTMLIVAGVVIAAAVIAALYFLMKRKK